MGAALPCEVPRGRLGARPSDKDTRGVLSAHDSVRDSNDHVLRDPQTIKPPQAPQTRTQTEQLRDSPQAPAQFSTGCHESTWPRDRAVVSTTLWLSGQSPLSEAKRAPGAPSSLRSSAAGAQKIPDPELCYHSRALPAPTNPRNVRIRRGEPLAKTPKTQLKRGDSRTVAQKRKFRSVHGLRAGLNCSPGNTPFWLYISCNAS